MKKLIVVFCILAVMIGVGVAEIVLTSRLFDHLQNSLTEVEISMAQHPKQFDNSETIEKIDETLRIWEKNRRYIFVVNNHLVMRGLEEKLRTLKTQIEINADQDAPVTLAVLQGLIKELKEESYPKLINLF